MKNINLGSIWRRWDLHFHTPSSYDYSDKSVSDIDIIKTLKDNHVEAVAVTDHYTIDASRIDSLRKEANGEITIFPGIELCTESRGSDPIHIIGVFPEDSDIPYVWKQLEVKLNISKQLKEGKKYQQLYCSLPDASQYIHELGGIVIIHAGSKSNSIETITNSLPVKMAEKKDIAECVDVFELGQEKDAKDYQDVVFKSIGKAYPLVLCSDNHNVKKYDIKQKLWIKSDPTFEGLMQIIYEPEGRVFIGEEPEIEMRVRNHPRRYIKSLRVNSVNGYDDRHGTWFKDENIELNKELIAIIGNKGSGKSAVADILGLLGNSHNQKYVGPSSKSEELFSFLNKDKFLKGNLCAQNFIGELFWYAGVTNTNLLNGITDSTIPESVEYLPQKYLEKICTNIEDDEFRQKLNEVIFGYVDEKDRYGKTNLESLIKYLATQTEEDIEKARVLLHTENEKVVEIESKLTQDYKKSIEEKLKLKTEEVEAHNKIKPAVVAKPAKDDAAVAKTAIEISTLDGKITDLTTRILTLQNEQSTTSKLNEDLRQGRQAIDRQILATSSLEKEYKELLSKAGLKFSEIVNISVDYKKLDNFIESKGKRLEEINNFLLSEEDIQRKNLDPASATTLQAKSLVCQLSQAEISKKKIVDTLDKPNQDYQEYLKHQAKWQKRYDDLTGDVKNPAINTLNWLKLEVDNIAKVFPTTLLEARTQRDKISMDVLSKKKGQLNLYNFVKQSIDTEISKYGKDLEGYDISVDAGLRLDPLFFDEFFKYISQSVKGSFYSIDDGRTVLKTITDTISDWQDEKSVFTAIESITEHIDYDKRPGLPPEENKVRDIFKQMKQSKNPIDFYDYLFGFEYLKPKYDLRVDKKDLSELSPGERGGLLLIFYLMLDRRDIPLIIDQPEDNLDNKSIYEILVRFLKKAKRKRQIIMVTHNPNLAVVADAEQIIHVSIDKKSKNDFDFLSGSIENPEINKCVVDILEGTMPAFDNRRLKYRKQPSS